MRASRDLKGSTSQLLCTHRFQAAQQLLWCPAVEELFARLDLAYDGCNAFMPHRQSLAVLCTTKTISAGSRKILFYFLSNAGHFLPGFSLNETFTAHKGPFRTVGWMATAKNSLRPTQKYKFGARWILFLGALNHYRVVNQCCPQLELQCGCSCIFFRKSGNDPSCQRYV